MTNPTVMQKCNLRCSTGDVVLEGILNAVCKNMAIEAGAGCLTLRFGGKQLLQNLQVSINMSAGPINITMSPEIPARIIVVGTNQVKVGNSIMRIGGDDNIYETPAYQGTPDKKIEISISGGPGIIYLNSPSSY